MVGLRHLATRSPPIPVKSLDNMSMKLFGCISLMSAPAANAFSLPVTTMHPTPSSASRSSIAAAISLKTPNDSALSILGRFSLTMPTAPVRSTMMCSKVLMIDPALPWPAGCGRRQCARGPGSLQGRARPLGTDPARHHRGPLSVRKRTWGRCWFSGHEHPGGGCHRQQSAEGDEDFSDQRGLVPG